MFDLYAHVVELAVAVMFTGATVLMGAGLYLVVEELIMPLLPDLRRLALGTLGFLAGLALMLVAARF